MRILARQHVWIGRVVRREIGRGHPFVANCLEYRDAAWWEDAQEKYQLRSITGRTARNVIYRQYKGGASVDLETVYHHSYGLLRKTFAQDAAAWNASRDAFFSVKLSLVFTFELDAR